MRTPFRLLLAVILLATASCSSSDTTDAIGDLIVITHLTGTPDPNGYTVSLTGHGSMAIGVTDTVTFGAIPIGDYTVALTDVAVGCTVTDGASQPVYVSVGTKNFDFTVTCP